MAVDYGYSDGVCVGAFVGRSEINCCTQMVDFCLVYGGAGGISICYAVLIFFFWGSRMTEFIFRMRTRSWFSAFIFLMLFLATCFLALALITYRSTDASLFFQSSDPAPLSNKAGFLGAHIAALCFFIFGNAAFFLVALLFFMLYALGFNGTMSKSYDQIIGWCLALLSSSMLGAWYRVCAKQTRFYRVVFLVTH